MKPKIIRISTVPGSLAIFLKGFLRRLDEEYEVVAVSSPGPDLDLVRQREGVRTVAVPMERHISIFRDVVSLLRLIVLFAKERPQIVHSMTPKAGLLAMLAAWVTRVPVRIHTFTGLVFPTSTGLKRKVLMLMDSLTCFCATYINPEGQGVANDLNRFGITRKPMHIIANGNVRGIDAGYYDRTPEVIAAAAKYRDDSMFTFCFVGRLVGDKGINELVSAFCRLVHDCGNVRLLLVGKQEPEQDPLKPGTLALLDSVPEIVMPGPQSDVRPYLAASDAFVFPSYREGFPNVVLEAGAMGLPCIATDINGSNEIVRDGVNGEIIPPRDEETLYSRMRVWVAQPDKVRKMASAARDMIIGRYDRQMIWDALLGEYRSLLAKSAKR